MFRKARDPRAAAALAFAMLIPGVLGLARGDEEASVAEGKTGEAALRKKALGLNDLTGGDPMRGALQEMTEDSAGTKKLLAVAVKMTKEKPQPFNRNTTLLLALAAENVKEVDASAAFYRLNAQQALKLQSERGLAQAYVGLIQLYSENKRFAESEKVCKEFLALEGEEDDAVERLKPLVMRRMVLAVAKQGSADRALKMVDELVKSDPRNWLHRALKADVLREADKLEEAAKAYLDVIDRVKRDGRIEKEDQDSSIDEYRYALSGIYIDLGDVDKAAEQLKQLLEREPNNPTYNNDLGYIWADHGMNLAEAEKLIRKAIDEERKLKQKLKIEGTEDNAAYLDSLGWVLFKQGKAKEAKPHLLAAVKQKEGRHLEIYDHLADVHQALGEKAEAVAAWKKGLEHAAPGKRDQKRKAEVEKKLKAAEEK
jgi:tetratricopeptide (TPR) repeat protein